MCRSIISRTLATLVSAAIDLARGMGLNKDGTHYGNDAVETQVHRMIWHQLCFLDIRVCETQSPRARIRKDEFNTQFPFNLEDSELEEFDPRIKSCEKWTGMTLSNARMECNEKIRELYAARQRARQENESNESYSAYIKKMLEKIYNFQHYMEKKYYPMIDDAIPIQHYTRLVIKLHCRRMHAMILHEYHMSTSRGRLPGRSRYLFTPSSPLLTVTSTEQLSRTVIKSGLEAMEIAREIETSEFLRPWRWYAGALQQHSYATLMLIEVFGSPGADYAKRAWESLDWIFQVPACVPHIHKGRWVLQGALGVMKEYLKARKLRCPTLMDERLERDSRSLPQKLSQTPEANNSRQDVKITPGTQEMSMHGMVYDYTEQVCTDRLSRPVLSFSKTLHHRVLTITPETSDWGPTRLCVPICRLGTSSQRRTCPCAQSSRSFSRRTRHGRYLIMAVHSRFHLSDRSPRIRHRRPRRRISFRPARWYPKRRV